LIGVAVCLFFIAKELEWVKHRNLQLSITNGEIVSQEHSVIRLVLSIFVAVLLAIIFGIVTWPAKERDVAHHLPDEKPKDLAPPNFIPTKKTVSPKAPLPNAKPEEPRIEIPIPTGNLKDRTISLSADITRDLNRHGWHTPNLIETQLFPGEEIPMPTTPEGVNQWVKARSDYFKFNFLTRLTNIRDDFAKCNYRDPQLDEFFRFLDYRIGNEQPDIPVQDIEQVAVRLRVMAENIKAPDN